MWFLNGLLLMQDPATPPGMFQKKTIASVPYTHLTRPTTREGYAMVAAQLRTRQMQHIIDHCSISFYTTKEGGEDVYFLRRGEVDRK